MAQVYSFVDDNGVTRLFAEIHPDPAGTPFDGGTINSPLTIASDSQPQFLIKDATGVTTLAEFDASPTRLDIYRDPNGASAPAIQFRTTGLRLYDNAFNLLLALSAGDLQLGVLPQMVMRGAAALFVANAAPPDSDINAGECAVWFDKTDGASKLATKGKQADGTVVAPGFAGRDIATAPAVSSSSTLALGTAYQNTLGYDVLLCVYLSVTVNTSGVLKLGVGPTTTPTQQTLVTGITSTGLWPVPIYLPDQYYALLSTTGTITVAVDGQIAMPV